MTGKTRRMGRLLKGAERRCLLVPLDHGPWLGPTRGIHAPLEIATKVLAGGANALLVTPGFTKAIMPALGPAVGIVLRVSILPGLAPGAMQETPIASVETALRLDADAVAVSIFFGRGDEGQTLRFLGELTEACNRYDLPVVAEMMPPADKSFDADAIGHAARIGFELGADIIKTNLCWTNLSGANLSGVSLCGANLSGADLTHADLKKANLSRANLDRAKLGKAKINRANFDGAKGV